MTNKFDELLVQLGTGRWNYLYFISASVWFFLIPPQGLSGAYLAPLHNYTCVPPPGLNATLAQDSCSYFVNTTVEGVTQSTQEKCTQWTFDTSVFHSTLTSEFGLVCERDYLRATYQSTIMLGAFIGPFFGGILADMFGRRLVVSVVLALFTIFATSIALVTNFTAIVALRFALGVVNLPTYYILAMEVCQPRQRSWVGVLTALPWAVGTMAWGGAAWLVRDWRKLQLLVSLPNLVIFPALYLMDESPRWLITQGRHDQALKALQKAARWNGSTLPPEDHLRKIMMEIQSESGGTQDTAGPTKPWYKRLLSRPLLLSTRRISTITLVMGFDYMVVAMVFYGLSLSGTSFSADPFTYMVLAGLMEVPAYSITAPVIARFGRRYTTAGGFAVCGVALLALPFLPDNLSWLTMTLAMLGKMFISAAYQIIYVYVTELFPTEVRNRGMGSSVFASRIGSILSPYVTDMLGPSVPWAPSVIFGGTSAVAGLATLLLPETLGASLPDTIPDLDRATKARPKDAEVPGELVVLSSELQQQK